MFPALSAQVQVGALAVEVALKLFGRKSAGVVRTRVRELVQFGDVKKKTRDTTAPVVQQSIARCSSVNSRLCGERT